MKKKSVAKNSLFNTIYKGVTAVFPLITTAYVSRALLPEGVGSVTYATTIVTYFTLIASLGIPNYGIKAIAQKAESLEERSRTFFELFQINLIASIICIAAYYCFINTFSYYEGRRILFNIVGIRLFLNILNVDWFYQGMEEYKMISIRGITVRFISFLLIILFVHQPSDYLKYALILCLGTAGNNIYNAFHLRRHIKFDWYQLNLKQHMSPILVLLASTVATEIYTMLDTVMLEYFHGTASVGYYSNAVKIVRMIYSLTIAMATPFYPRISWYIRNNSFDDSNRLLNDGSKVVFLLAIPAATGLIATSNILAPVLFGKAFVPTGEVLKILSILVIVFSTAYLFGHIILMAAGQEKYILRATISGAIVNFVLNYVLIPVLSQNGAAIASVSAEIAVTAILIRYAWPYFELELDRKYLKSVVISIGIMMAVVLTEKRVLQPTVFSASILIFSAVMVYLFSLSLTKNEAFLMLKRRIQRKDPAKEQNEQLYTEQK